MIHSFIFSEGRLISRDLEIEGLRLVRADKGLVVWVDLDNPTDGEVRQILEEVYQFHPLAIEDCVTPSSLPKVEDYEDYLFMVMHAVDFSREGKFSSTELDLFLGKEFVVTYHRSPLVSVQSTIERCARTTGVVARGPDRIAHFLLDALVDNFTPALNELRLELEEIEVAVLAQSSDKRLVANLLQVRGDYLQFREIVRSQRDIAERLARGDSKLVRASLLPYYRDLRDNLARLETAAANGNDRLMIAFDIFLNKAAFETNEGIKVLTALTALTVPPLLVGTWYGMNFHRMPELDSPIAYPLITVATIATTAFMWWYLKRKRLL